MSKTQIRNVNTSPPLTKTFNSNVLIDLNVLKNFIIVFKITALNNNNNFWL